MTRDSGRKARTPEHCDTRRRVCDNENDDANNSGAVATFGTEQPAMRCQNNPTEKYLALALFPTRTTGLLFSLFGAVGTLLAVSGLLGVIAYSVSQRTREIGIRVALGAERSDVQAMVVRQGMKLVVIGILVGLGGAVAATRLLRNFLFGVSSIDPVTFTLVPILLSATALLACCIPARRASKVDPMLALRCE